MTRNCRAAIQVKNTNSPHRRTNSEQRDCYCPDGPAGTAPITPEVPPGFCGVCEVCGHPGHTRHFPGTSPVTGAWCDAHYRRTAWLHPMGHYGRWLYAGALLAFALIAIGLLARR
jgi:hypothetical protein